MTGAFRSRHRGETHVFDDLKTLLACASPRRSGDELAGVAADSAARRVAARMALADVPLRRFLDEPLIPYETDEVTRLILDSHDAAAFAPVAALTVGQFREWLLSWEADADRLATLAPGLTPEMVAAVSKLCGNGDLIAIAAKCRVVTAFRSTIGLPGRLSSRLQPNDPTDDPQAIAAGTLDGLLFGMGDAVIGINPATDNVEACIRLLSMLDDIRCKFEVPTQSCVLSHVTTSIQAIEQGAPLDLVFQSIAGTEAANAGFGVTLALLAEAQDAAQSLKRGTIGSNVMYFETGQGAALSADITASISRPSRPAPTRSRAPSRRCWSIPSSASSVRNICTTQRKSSAPGWRIISAPSCSACRWAATSATPTMPRPIRTTWTIWRCCSRRPMSIS